VSLAELGVKVAKTAAYHGRRLREAGRDLLWPLADPHRFAHPVLVVGCSRAGTTLVYKTLSLAPDLASLNREAHAFWGALHPPEENGWSGHEFTAADARAEDRERALRYYHRYLGAHRFVDKTNQNGFRLPYLDALFEEPTFVFVKRSPGDNIASLMTGWGRPDEYGDWSAELPAEVRIDAGRYRRWCFFLFPGWRDYLEAPIEAVVAAQWAAYNDAVLAARVAIPPDRFVEVAYEALLADPVAAFRELFTAVGADFSPPVARHCETVISRPYNAFSAPRVDKWRDTPEAGRIEAVLPKVAATAQALGYALGGEG